MAPTPNEHTEAAEEGDQIRELHQTALRSALRSAMCGPRTSVDEVDGAATGWLAHLALKALTVCAPDAARQLAETVQEHVAGGEYFEYAWDAAEKRGMDVQAWAEEARAHHSSTHRCCGNCEGVDPESCMFNQPPAPETRS